MDEQRKRNVIIYIKKRDPKYHRSYHDLSLEYNLTKDRIYNIIRDVEFKLLKGEITEKDVKQFKKELAI